MRPIDTMEERKQSITLQPNQFVIFSPGLKIENVGDAEIRFELPHEVIYTKREFDIRRIEYRDSKWDADKGI